MVLNLKVPKLLLSFRWIEVAVASFFKLKKVRFTSYYKAEEVFFLFPRIKDTNAFFKYVSRSSKIHGVIYKDELYIHPHTVRKYLKKKYRGMIRKELKRTSKFNVIL